MAAAEVRLKRSLGLWDLVIYGIILIQPTAALPLFGVVSQEARGHVVTTLLIGMVAMGAWRESIPARARRSPTWDGNSMRAQAISPGGAW